MQNRKLVPPLLNIARAHGLRRSMTPSESALWAAIRGKRLGVALCAQVPVGNFIADFVASAERLIVESMVKFIV